LKDSKKLSTGFRDSDMDSFDALQRAIVREDKNWEEFVLGFKLPVPKKIQSGKVRLPKSRRVMVKNVRDGTVTYVKEKIEY